MNLTLTTLRCPEAVPPQTRRVEGGEFSIGRGVDNDWVLPDPARHLSKRHCLVRFADGAWTLADVSTNGTFVNQDNLPLGPDEPRPLRDGDRLRLGMYELEVRIAADQPALAPRDAEAAQAEDATRVFRPLEEPAPSATAAAAAAAAPSVTAAKGDERAFEPSPFDEFLDPLPAPPAAPATAAPGTSPGAPDLLAAFLRGAGLPPVAPADPEATMEALGAAFRVVVSGVRQVLQARASIKSEFRIEQTMIRARGNNPLKFSAGDDDALASMVGAGRRTDMPAAEALRDALRDMQLHELASMAAMQAAVRALVAGFDPEKIRAASDQGGISLVAAQRKARAWDAFEAQHARTAQALADDFDSVFGKVFAAAYEQTLQEASARTESF